MGLQQRTALMSLFAAKYGQAKKFVLFHSDHNAHLLSVWEDLIFKVSPDASVHLTNTQCSGRRLRLSTT